MADRRVRQGSDPWGQTPGTARQGSDPTGLTPCTGVLLVGGASERFGSPKALAHFRGETLAERGWRVLSEVCDEVIAVGKTAGEHELPFPVLGDAADEHAPVFGVMAGLRAASNDVCLVLPVDCPLVTAAALRALVEARAVPQTGPLPGAYTKAMLPDLEGRVAGGELSLMGVNAKVLEIDDRLLANVNTRMDLMAAAIGDWAQEREDVRAAVVLGSRAHADLPADQWADLDVDLIVDELQPFVEDSEWIREFGNPTVALLEQTPFGYRRRVLYATGEDVDFPLLPIAVLDRLESSAEYARLLARGFRVLVDKIELEQRLHAHAARAAAPAGPSQSDLDKLTADFWYHALWTAKKLRRGEVFTAIDCLDGYMKVRLVTLLEWHARAVDPSVDTWHAGRFLERWADPGALSALEKAFAHYDVRDVARALWETIDLFQGLEEETASRLGLEVELDQTDLRRRVAEVVPDPRGTSTLWP